MAGVSLVRREAMIEQDDDGTARGRGVITEKGDNDGTSGDDRETLSEQGGGGAMMAEMDDDRAGGR